MNIRIRLFLESALVMENVWKLENFEIIENNFQISKKILSTPKSLSSFMIDPFIVSLNDSKFVLKTYI